MDENASPMAPHVINPSKNYMNRKRKLNSINLEALRCHVVLGMTLLECTSQLASVCHLYSKHGFLSMVFC